MLLNSVLVYLGRVVFLWDVLFWNTPGSVLIPTVNSLLEVLPVTEYSPLYPVLPNPVVLRPDTILVIATLDPTDNSCGISEVNVATPTVPIPASQTAFEINLGFLNSEVLLIWTGSILLYLSTSASVNPTVELDSWITNESVGGLDNTVESLGTTYLTL